jgi:hypothetical protein
MGAELRTYMAGGIGNETSVIRTLQRNRLLRHGLWSGLIECRKAILVTRASSVNRGTTAMWLTHLDQPRDKACLSYIGAVVSRIHDRRAPIDD